MSSRWIWDFSTPLAGSAVAKDFLGGKGASLKDMTLAGLRVPPGFTIAIPACLEYLSQSGKWPVGLEGELAEALSRLEQLSGRTFGRGPRPLLVSVRSGAALSMPGMMDTLLNCGLTLELGRELGSPGWYWKTYREFIAAFASTVHGVARKDFAEQEDTEAGAKACLEDFHQKTGAEFPQDAIALLKLCVNAVFDSWNSERAIAYRKRHDLRGLGGTAVTVQMMFPSEVSGVAFTMDPTAPDSQQMVIEGSYGLGEAVVSGDVTPDRFVLSREPIAVKERVLGRKTSSVRAFGAGVAQDAEAFCLTEAQVVELGELCLKVEAHFGKPMDIEWGLVDGGFALLQSRPIRGLEVHQEIKVASREEGHRLGEVAKGQRRVWVAHNLGETLRLATPLTWDICRKFMSGSGGFGRLYQMLGYRPSQRVKEEGFLELILGRVYADPHRLSELFWDAMPLVYNADDLVRDKRLLDAAPTQFEPQLADGRFLAQLPANVLGMWRASKIAKRLEKSALRDLEQKTLPSYMAWVKEQRVIDLRSIGTHDLLALLADREERVLGVFGAESLLPGFLGGVALSRLEGLLTQIMGAAEAAPLVATLTAALEGDITFRQNLWLHEVARGERTIESFLADFGHRASNEMELSQPRWDEDVELARQMAARLKNTRSPAEGHAAARARRLAAEASLPALLAQYGGSSLSERIAADLGVAQQLLPWRETAKYYLMMGYRTIREVTEELSRRWDLGQDVYYLTLAELREFEGRRTELEGKIAARKLRRQAWQKMDPPEVVDSNDLANFGLARRVADEGAVLSATPMAPGVAAGTVRIVHDPASPGELGEGYVLVCASTDPGWTPLMVGASALIVERGGVLSHGAIVARDFGIPAVACPGATTSLTAGQRVRVDANEGRIVRE